MGWVAGGVGGDGVVGWVLVLEVAPVPGLRPQVRPQDRRRPDFNIWSILLEGVGPHSARPGGPRPTTVQRAGGAGPRVPDQAGELPLIIMVTRPGVGQGGTGLRPWTPRAVRSSFGSRAAPLRAVLFQLNILIKQGLVSPRSYRWSGLIGGSS